jgi:hypothetical protein
VDFFHAESAGLVARDLGVERGLWTPEQSRYRMRTWAVDAERRAAGDVPAWNESDELRLLPLSDGPDSHPFQAAEYQVDRGDGWGPSVLVYVARSSRRVVGVER